MPAASVPVHLNLYSYLHFYLHQVPGISGPGDGGQGEAGGLLRREAAAGGDGAPLHTIQPSQVQYRSKLLELPNTVWEAFPKKKI